MVEDLLQRHLAVQLSSSATKTAPRPPFAWGRKMRNRWPSDVALPT